MRWEGNVSLYQINIAGPCAPPRARGSQLLVERSRALLHEVVVLQGCVYTASPGALTREVRYHCRQNRCESVQGAWSATLGSQGVDRTSEGVAA